MAVCSVLSALLVTMLLQICNCGDDGSYYTNRFMVEVEGGHKMADKVAHTHGMMNLGSVSILVETNVGIFDDLGRRFSVVWRSLTPPSKIGKRGQERLAHATCAPATIVAGQSDCRV